MKQKTAKSRQRALRLFLVFSFFENLLNYLLEILPPFLRHLYFRTVCKKFGRNVIIDYRSYIRYPHKVTFGDNVAINRGCQIFPSLLHRDAEIIFCDGVVLGPNVTIFGAGQDPNYVNLPDVASSVTIGRGVYIGGNSVIRYGVDIGEFAVVAAGSVVVRDVPPRTIVGGVPAKKISQRVMDCETIEKLQD